MTARWLRLALLSVRGWTRVYTWRLPEPMRDARRAEIESDLWEFLHDAERDPRVAASVQLFGRLLLGVSDDLWWRLEYEGTRHAFLVRRLGAVAAVALVPMALWIVSARCWHSEPSARTRVSDCAQASPSVATTPELRLRVITCAGVFFTRPRPPEAPPDQP
jgi:hypothetical protein